MSEGKCEIGMVGLGVMGRSLLLNIAEHGFSAAGYDKDPQRLDALREEAGMFPVHLADDVPGFTALLTPPRSVMLLVPAGPIVDSVLHGLLPHLEPGDLVIDAGNSLFTDTDLRAQTLEARGLHFMGMGISGGEEGARHGPSLMPGGLEQDYLQVQKILEAIAARVDDEPCVAYLGTSSAGHYVKMVHNGIEYGMMQLIAEAYDLLHRGLGLTHDQLGDIFDQWNQAELNAYLVEITAKIFRTEDDFTGKPLVGFVLDAARQLGTGMWVSQDALELRIPTPTIDTSVVMRNLSALQAERSALGSRYPVPSRRFTGEPGDMIEKIRRALYASIILTFAQGFSQLAAASRAYGYNLNLETVARIWRGGCIIRFALLESIRSVFSHQAGMPNMLLDEVISRAVSERLPDLCHVVQSSAELSLPVPAFMASLSYFESLRSVTLPANLIMAQRDYFGAHTYERVDKRGIFHTQWSKEDE